jgi:hypothetical protein
MPPTTARHPHWYGISLRVLLATFIGTLFSFSVSLLLAIIAIVVVSRVRGVHPDMTVAYRQIALPTALVAGAIIFALALVMEIRHHRQSKALSTIEKMS